MIEDDNNNNHEIDKIIGKSFGPPNNENSNSQDNNEFEVSEAQIREIEEEAQEQIKEEQEHQKSQNRKKQEKNNIKKQQYFIQKYHDSNTLAESVIVEGKPYFAVAKSNNNSAEPQITLEESLTPDKPSELKPYELISYINKPYIFKSRQEFDDFIEKAKNETLDSLYRKVKSIWGKYIDADDFHISICAADTIFTYYQDKLGLSHYLFFVGGNNAGKSNNLTILHFLAYRNMTSTDMSAANIYQFLGFMEEGQGTICEDEADDIDADRDKMRIYKNGYTTGFAVAKTDTTYGRKQYKFNTYCFKAFAAEKLPDSFKAKGFNQRIIELPCTFGFPKYDITEVANPAGEEEFQMQLDELNETRNLLLAYRLLHYNDKIPNIKLNIQNREKQLFKSVIRVFQNTETLKELLPVISKYVSQKREGNATTLYAFLYRIVKDLIKNQNSLELDSSFIWNYIIDNLSGDSIPGKKYSFDSSEFGVISQKFIIGTLMEVFGAKPSRNRRDKRRLVFDKYKLERLGNIYDVDVEIKVGQEQQHSYVTHETDM
jgi:hypothetical protein